jgi:hypothetical protein
MDERSEVFRGRRRVLLSDSRHVFCGLISRILQSGEDRCGQPFVGTLNDVGDFPIGGTASRIVSSCLFPSAVRTVVSRLIW